LSRIENAAPKSNTNSPQGVAFGKWSGHAAEDAMYAAKQTKPQKEKTLPGQAVA